MLSQIQQTYSKQQRRHMKEIRADISFGDGAKMVRHLNQWQRTQNKKKRNKTKRNTFLLSDACLNATPDQRTAPVWEDGTQGQSKIVILSRSICSIACRKMGMTI